MSIIRKLNWGKFSPQKKNAAAISAVLFCGASAILSYAGEKPDFSSTRPAAERGVRDREIVASFPNWQWHNRGFLVNPETIAYEKNHYSGYTRGGK